MQKNKLLLLLVLLLTAATGAWAQEPATTYSVKMKSGTVDAGNWTIASGEKSAKGDAADGLTGLSEKDAVTLTYNGRLKVKGVKATSDAAAPAVPDGALSGVFSVSDGKQVNFSKGNLRYASSKWSFFDNQYDYYTSYSADAWDKFGWSTSATTYGMNTSISNNTYSGDFVDWGATMGTGWFTLSSAEWTYLFNTRSASTVNGTDNGRYAKAKVNDVPGVILFPDTYTHPDGVDAPTGVNATDETGWNGNSYTVADWTKMETAGCVFLPAAGYRNGSSVDGLGSYGYYWSATPYTTGTAYRVYSNSGYLIPDNSTNRRLGLSVRLVQATSGAAPAAGKTVDLSTLTADYEAQNGDVLTRVTTSYKVTIAAGATVTLDGATISSGDYCIKCSGDATIILKDGSTNTLTGTGGYYPALWIGDANTTLTIQGSTGVLNATSGDYGAGIGGGYMNTNRTCGNIRIEGGVITATGGYNAAGIGTDPSPATCGDIIITGGTITAKGGSYAAGIGTGYGNGIPAVCGEITIANTVTKVTATKGEDAPHSIGKGRGGVASCGTVTIGGTVYWQNNAAVGDGATYLAQSPLIYDPTAPAYTLLSAATTSDYGKVVCAAGHLHDAKTAVPDGCTAVGIVGKVTTTGHGLILALKDATSQNWNTINGWASVTTYASTTLKVLPNDAARGTNLTSYTTLGSTGVSNWAVAQKSDYVAIFQNLGSTKSHDDGTTYDGNVNAYITTGVGGRALSVNYWSATLDGDMQCPWGIFSNNGGYWNIDDNASAIFKIRPVLGF